MKKLSIAFGTAAAVSISSGVFAGGYESNALSTGFMYEAVGERKGFASISYGSRSYDIKGTVYAPTGSAVKDQNSTNVSAKYDVTDSFSVGVSLYNQGSIQLDYLGKGAAPNDVALPVVDLTIDARVILGKYNISDNISFMAGVKQTVVQDASANIFQSVPLPKSTITGGNELGYVYGAAYTNDEIAMRVELTMETSTDFSLATANAGAGPGTTTGSTPDYINLYLQSGIAEDTLMFGSIRKANWAENQLYVYPHGGNPTSSFTDSETYSLGIGRKFSDNFSGSVTLSGEPKGSRFSTTPLTITNGYQGITVGGKYTVDNMSITGGFNYTQVGDVQLTSGLGVGQFKDNTITGFGMKVGFQF
jgi:long-chain fatty acid transport protein